MTNNIDMRRVMIHFGVAGVPEPVASAVLDDVSVAVLYRIMGDGPLQFGIYRQFDDGRISSTSIPATPAMLAGLRSVVDAGTTSWPKAKG